MTARVRCATAFAALLIVSVAACGAESDKNPEAVPLPDPLPRVTTQDRLPYDDLMLDQEERETARAAYNELVRACAADFGVELKLVMDDPESLGEGFEMWSGRFGTLPLEHAPIRLSRRAGRAGARAVHDLRPRGRATPPGCARRQVRGRQLQLKSIDDNRELYEEAAAAERAMLDRAIALSEQIERGRGQSPGAETGKK